MFAKFFVEIIKLYQRFLSPERSFLRILGGPCCRFYPTCSQYAIDAIEKNGAAKGIWRGFKRILRCHPFSAGGYDSA